MEASLCPQSPKCCGSHRHQAVQSQGSSIRGEAGGHVLRDVGSFGTVPPKGLGEMRVGEMEKGSRGSPTSLPLRQADTGRTSSAQLPGVGAGLGAQGRLEQQ